MLLPLLSKTTTFEVWNLKIANVANFKKLIRGLENLSYIKRNL